MSHHYCYYYYTRRRYISLLKAAATGAAGWLIGAKIHSKRAVTKANKKHQKAQAALYTKYVTDVQALQTQNAQLKTFIRESARQSLKDDFLRADYSDDGQVTRAEFEQYKKEYLRKHPDQAATFPKFEDFDPDHNGVVTFREHQQYYEKAGMI